MPETEDERAAPREVELKLEMEPGAMVAVRAHPLLRDVLARARPKRLHATYFDTPDRLLREAGLSLRIRRSGRRRVQTVKAASGPAAGLFDRDEWEQEVRADIPDLASEAGLPDLLRRSDVAAALAPAFAVRVERTTLDLAQGASRAEITIDEGVVEAGGRRDAVAEVEIELKDGAAADLFALARALAEGAPLRLGIRTKADRGYTLADGRPLKAVKSSAAHVAPGLTAGQGFQAIARACLVHLLRNEPVLRAGRDPDAVHQMRVAMRRLRAAVSLHKAILSDERRDRIAAEVKWMAGELGEARDLDVFLGKSVRPALAGHGDDADLAALAADLEARREAAYDAALEAIGSPRFRAMLIDLAEWIEVGPWLSGGDGERDGPVEAFAAEVLGRRAKRIRKRGRRLATLAPEPRHDLRIAVKKLRYAVEFFGPAFTGGKAERRRKAYLAALEDLQEHLGDLNDLAVGRERLAALPASERLAPLLLGGADERRMLERAVDAFESFADAKPFWG
ncbi:MAG TPA: CHAD domain-containing protein [Salinarimonas sp.]|nr:CHAD domain-containing protein [Salinarimonas sp.]